MLIRIEEQDQLTLVRGDGKTIKSSMEKLDTLLAVFVPANPQADYFVKITHGQPAAELKKVTAILARHKIFRFKLITETDNK